MRRGQTAVAVLMCIGLLVPGMPNAQTIGNAVIGTGRIGPELPGQTIPSPSDFGFYADATGGNFVCSMGGSATGGWAGTEIMLVQGVVVPGSLRISGNSARFKCRGSLLMVPGRDGAPLKLPPSSPPPAVIIRNAPFSVEVTVGGAGVGSLVLKTHLRAFLGGNTGGVLSFGEISLK